MRRAANLFCLLGLLLTISRPTLCQVAPARLDINLGPVPLDRYSNGSNAGSIPSCPDGWTIQRCIQRTFSNSPGEDRTPNNYVVQGVRGVRFMFGLGGGADSTPFDASGNLRTPWLNNLRQFFSDLHSWGIERITPTPLLAEEWSAAGEIAPAPDGHFKYRTQPVRMSLQVDHDGNPATLAVSVPLFFLKWLPFGLLDCKSPSSPSGCIVHAWPDGIGNNQAYNQASQNPHFWGWQPFFNIMGYVFYEAALNGLQIADLDLQNETDVVNATVLARLLFDTTTQTDVLGEIRDLMYWYGFDPGRVTVSTKIERPTTNGAVCDSYYGDSAQIIYTSALDRLLRGWYFGNSLHTQELNGLRCWNAESHGACYQLPPEQQEACLLGDMPTAPLSYIPTVINMHSHVCVAGASPDGSGCLKDDSTNTARQLYSDVYRFLREHHRLDHYVVFGETVNDQDGALDARFGILNNIRHTDGFTKQMAQWNVAGFRQSDLYVMRTGTANQDKTVLRPWNYLMEHELKRAPSITWPEKEADPANPLSDAVINSPRDLTQPPYRPQLEWGVARYKVPHNLSSYTGSSTGASADWMQEYHLEVKSAQGATIFSGGVGLNTYKNDLDLSAWRGQQVTVRIGANVAPDDPGCTANCWEGGGTKWRFLKTFTYYALEAPGALSVAPDTITLAASQAAGFSAQINGGASPAVTWTLDPPLGSLTATQGATTTYTAPSSISSPTTVTITATSTQNPNNSDSAIIYLQSGVTFSISPSSAILTAGGSGTTFAANGYPYGTQWIDWTVTPEIGALQPMGAHPKYPPSFVRGYYRQRAGRVSQDKILVTGPNFLAISAGGGVHSS
jgi:hypothetical protein